ncbi:centrosomal protein 15 isoform X2 [Notamacropus eugenii]|uniref:centrosomal protein 15 isoform X2 n=1 Tax=Notamacropus eugenii TaxID=9315 RepID=UPI003B6838A0
MLEPSDGPSAPAPQPPAEARRRARRENFHQHQGGLTEGKGMAYFAKEVQLTKKHEEILAQRLLLLEEMEKEHGGQKTEKKASYLKAAKLANKRNQSLLNPRSSAYHQSSHGSIVIENGLQNKDIRTLEEKLEKNAHLQSQIEMVNLQASKISSVRGSLSRNGRMVWKLILKECDFSSGAFKEEFCNRTPQRMLSLLADYFGEERKMEERRLLFWRK